MALRQAQEQQQKEQSLKNNNHINDDDNGDEKDDEEEEQRIAAMRVLLLKKERAEDDAHSLREHLAKVEREWTEQWGASSESDKARSVWMEKDRKKKEKWHWQPGNFLIGKVPKLNFRMPFSIFNARSAIWPSRIYYGLKIHRFSTFINSFIRQIPSDVSMKVPPLRSTWNEQNNGQWKAAAGWANIAVVPLPTLMIPICW